jgi:hypothetical protein
VHALAASWRASLQLRRISALLWGRVVETKLRDLEHAIKANFDPNQPRVPAGNPDGGQWTDAAGVGALSGSAETDSLAGGDENVSALTRSANLRF